MTGKDVRLAPDLPGGRLPSHDVPGSLSRIERGDRMAARAQTGVSRNGAGKERRQHDRVPTRLAMGASDVEGQRFQIETSNLSAGGAYCRSDRRFPVMTRLEVSVDLPGDGG